MLMQFQNYLTFENIYLWGNLGILPFWIMLIVIPGSKFTQFFVNSVIIPLILSAAYVYVIYQTLLLDEPMLNFFQLYLSLDNLYTLFATESFLLVFWLHFLSLNLFLGSWMARDGVKNNVSRWLLIISIVMVYFAGPVGLVFYWIIRIFYAKRITFHD